MKPRGVLLIAVGACLAVMTLALLCGRAPAQGTICPASGYAFVGDVELAFSEEPASVSACFGEGCIPAPVVKNTDGRWLVPQTPPYLAPPASVSSVFVKAATPSGARVDRQLPIETEPTGEYPFGRACGGPFRFKPVDVVL